MVKDEKKKWKSSAVGQADTPSIYEFIDKPLEAGLWCLYLSKNNFGIEYLTYEDLENILREFLDLPITTKQLKKAFARSGNKVIKNSRGEGYKISNPGENYLRGLKKDEPLNIV